MYPKLNFPGYNFKLIPEGGDERKAKVFDMVRKKYVSLTPEEWVRQHLIHYLVIDKQVPRSLIGVEKKIMVNNQLKRTDLVIYGKNAAPLLIAECKSASVKITQDAFDQAARYNLSLKVKYFVLTNGIEIYCCTVDDEKKVYHFLKEIPAFHELQDNSVTQ